MYVYMHTYMYRKKNQGGVRQASGLWTVVVSLSALIGREYVKLVWNTIILYVHVHVRELL